LAPSAQFKPMASGRAWRTEFQNASVVCPDSVRPEASVIVPEMMMGTSMPDSSTACLAANTAAFDQRPRAFEIRRRELVEIDVAKCRIVDVRRQRRRAIRRTERTCDERHLARRRCVLVGRATRDLRTREIDVAHQLFGAVVGLRGVIRRKRVGLDDVRARVEILAMNLGDDLRLRQHQDVAVALEVAGPRLEALAAIVALAEAIALDHGAHRAVDHQDALRERLAECVDAFGSGRGHAETLSRSRLVRPEYGHSVRDRLRK